MGSRNYEQLEEFQLRSDSFQEPTSTLRQMASRKESFQYLCKSKSLTCDHEVVIKRSKTVYEGGMPAETAPTMVEYASPNFIAIQ